jgi:hypothetical protein
MEKVDEVESVTEPCSIAASRGSRWKEKEFLTRDAQEAKDQGVGCGGGGGGGGGAVVGTREASFM